EAQAVVAQHLEVQLLALDPVQGAAIGAGELAGGLQDAFQQGRQDALVREGDADGVEGFQSGKDVVGALHGGNPGRGCGKHEAKARLTQTGPEIGRGRSPPRGALAWSSAMFSKRLEARPEPRHGPARNREPYP